MYAVQIEFWRRFSMLLDVHSAKVLPEKKVVYIPMKLEVEPDLQFYKEAKAAIDAYNESRKSHNPECFVDVLTKDGLFGGDFQFGVFAHPYIITQQFINNQKVLFSSFGEKEISCLKSRAAEKSKHDAQVQSIRETEQEILFRIKSLQG